MADLPLYAIARISDSDPSLEWGPGGTQADVPPTLAQILVEAQLAFDADDQVHDAAWPSQPVEPFSAPTSPTLGGGELAPPSDTPSPTPPPRWGLWRRLRLLLSVFALGCGAAALWAAASLPSDRLASDTSSTVSAPRFAHDHPAHARPARAPTPP